MTATPVPPSPSRLYSEMPQDKTVPSRNAYCAHSIARGLGCVKRVQTIVGQSSSVVGASVSGQYVHVFGGGQGIKGKPERELRTVIKMDLDQTISELRS